jgi:hypothetical protein
MNRYALYDTNHTMDMDPHINGFTREQIFKMFLRAHLHDCAVCILSQCAQVSKSVNAIVQPRLQTLAELRMRIMPRVAEAYRRKLLKTVPHTRSCFRCYAIDELALSPRNGIVLESDPPFRRGLMSLRRIHLLLNRATDVYAFVNVHGWAPLAYTYNDILADTGHGRYLCTLPMNTDYNPILLGGTGYLPRHEDVELYASDREIIDTETQTCRADVDFMINTCTHIIVEYLVHEDVDPTEYEFVRRQSQHHGMLFPYIKKIHTADRLLEL